MPPPESDSKTVAGEEVTFPGTASLDPVTRLKLARGILDQTADATGAGYILIMLVPGTDLVLRSFKGLDSPEECVAAAAEVAGMLQQHVNKLKSGQKELHNGG
jgi:hypothetical protein